MILDASAVIAIIRREPEHEDLIELLEVAPQVGIGAPSLAEAGIVLAARLGASGRTLLARFVDENDLIVVGFEQRHWGVAVEAYVRFGKGRHPAALNFGDCMTYATASLAARPLLCVGDDFRQTDLELVRRG